MADRQFETFRDWLRRVVLRQTPASAQPAAAPGYSPQVAGSFGGYTAGQSAATAGLASGLAAGSTFGPVGAGVGALVGSALGLAMNDAARHAASRRSWAVVQSAINDYDAQLRAAGVTDADTRNFIVYTWAADFGIRGRNGLPPWPGKAPVSQAGIIASERIRDAARASLLARGVGLPPVTLVDGTTIQGSAPASPPPPEAAPGPVPAAAGVAAVAPGPAAAAVAPLTGPIFELGNIAM
jgi:hypothetical protein